MSLNSCGGGGGGVEVASAGIPQNSPSLDFQTSKTEVVSGDAFQLTWVTTNATSCEASGDWAGTKEISGTQQIITSSLSDLAFQLSCSGSTGTANALKSLAVKVLENDREGTCTNPHTAIIEETYLGNFKIESPQNSFGPDHIKAIGLKDYGIGWIYDSYKNKEPSLVSNCTKQQYVRLMYRETLRRLRDHGVTTVHIYNFGSWSDVGQWEVVHSSKHITDEEVDFITQTGHEFGLHIYYAWQFNMSVADPQTGNNLNRLLFPFVDGAVDLDMELLKKIMDAHETHIYWEADRAESIGIDGISADWSSMWVNFKGLDGQASANEEIELKEYYMERMGKIVSGVKERFSGKIIIGEGLTWNDERVWDQADIIKLGFPLLLSDSEIDDADIALIEERAAQHIARSYNTYYCLDNQPCWDRTSFNTNNHKMVFDLFAQSHAGFLSRGWIEDGFCVTGTIGNTSYDCIQRQVQPDFSTQAIWYEGVLRAIDKQTYFSMIGTTASTGYWLSDTLLHDGHTEAFPSTSQSVRGKPAEKIIKYWYSGEYEQYEPVYD